MKINQMKQIIKIGELGSINRAAQELFISQSSLSASVKAAEDELGMSVFQRSSGGAVPTKFGLRFIEASKQIVAIYESLFENGDDVAADRLCISSQFLRYAGSLFAELNEHFNGQSAEFKFKETAGSEVCKDVLSARYDLGIIVTPSPSRYKILELLNGEGLENHVLCTDEARCIVGPKNPLYSIPEDSISTEDMKPYQRLCYEQPEYKGAPGIFDEEPLMFPSTGLLYVSDTGSFNSMLTRTASYFIGVHNDHAYSVSDFYNNMRALRISDTDFSYDTIWIKRKNARLPNMVKRYLILLYRMVGLTPDFTVI